MKKLFRNIIDGIKINFNYFKSTINDNNAKYFCTSEITEDGYIIRHNTSLVVKSKASICVCVIVEFENNIYVPCLFTDGLFDMVSKETQEFIIQHEMGHFNKHLNIILENSKLERDINLEYQADEFAMEKLNKEQSIKALNEIKEIGIRMQYGFGKRSAFAKELDKRIYHLKNL